MTRKALESAGYIAQNVEHWNERTQRKHDLFGIIDVLGAGEGGTIAVQATSRSNANERVKKIHASGKLPFLLAAGWQVEVWGWFKQNNRWVFERKDCGESY